MSTESIAVLQTVPVPVDLIDPSPANKRMINNVSIAELAENIKAQGLLQAIIIRKHPKDPIRYELVAGERRFRACRKLGSVEIPAVIRDLTDAQAHDITVSENLQREDLSPLEEALSIQTLIDDGRDPKEIADKIGKPVSWVIRRVKLKDLSEKWIKGIMDENCGLSAWSAAHLEKIARYEEGVQDELFEEFSEDSQITVKELVDCLARRTCKLSSAPWKFSDDTILPDVGSCELCEKRSSFQPDLFVEYDAVKKDDRCLDEECWSKKMRTFHSKKLEELKTENKPFVIFDKACGDGSLHHNDPLKKDVEYAQYKYEKAKKSDPEVIQAYIIDGPQAGKVNYVKLKKEYKEEESKVLKGESTLEDKMKSLTKRRVIRLINKLILIITGKNPDLTGKLPDMCEVCGCTELNACLGGCAWVAPGLCSACAEKAEKVFDSRAAIAESLSNIEVFALVSAFGAGTARMVTCDMEGPWDVYKAVIDTNGQQALYNTLLCAFDRIEHSLRQLTYAQDPDTSFCFNLIDAVKLSYSTLWNKVLEEIPEPKAWEKLKKKEAGEVEKKYIYKGSIIFVSPGIGGDTFGTFKNTEAGSGIKRIVTDAMPMVSSKEEAQRNLDKFAEDRSLEEIMPD